MAAGALATLARGLQANEDASAVSQSPTPPLPPAHLKTAAKSVADFVGLPASAIMSTLSEASVGPAARATTDTELMSRLTGELDSAATKHAEEMERVSGDRDRMLAAHVEATARFSLDAHGLTKERDAAVARGDRLDAQLKAAGRIHDLPPSSYLNRLVLT